MSNKEKEIKNKISVRELEEMYVGNVVDGIDKLVEERRGELVEKLIEYKDKCTEEVVLKNGETIERPCLNNYVIQRYFFRSINPFSNKEPKYSAEKLGVVWDLYNEILVQVNIEIGEIMPTLTSFCTFAGITLNTLRGYGESTDIEMRTIVNKIKDMCFDSNISQAQRGKVREKSTIYRMKAEQDIREGESGKTEIHFHNDGGSDLRAINERINAMMEYSKKRGEIEDGR